MAFKDKDKQRAFQLNWILAKRKKHMARLGACFFCGTAHDIQPHHIDPSKKWSHRIWSYCDEKIEMELKQCIALCKHCHTKYEALRMRRTIVHGTVSAYRYGCRCPECKEAKHRDYRARKAFAAK